MTNQVNNKKKAEIPPATITHRLMALDPTLHAYNEGQWGSDNPWSIGFHSFNDAGIECETGEFLYGLIRIMQPKKVLETGTHWGVGSAYMGMALKDNGDGVLDTVEFLPEIYSRAQERIRILDLERFVKCYLIDASKFVASHQYQVMLLDTEPQTRFAELLRFFPFLSPGGFVFIHDLHRHMHQIPNAEHGFAWPYGKIPVELKQLVNSGQLRPIHFSTPRGLTGFYKPHAEDFQWEK